MAASLHKILIISSEFPPNVGGIGNHAYNLAKALAGEGLEVTVIADIIEVAPHELKDFEAQQPFEIRWIPRRRFVFLSYLQRIYKAVALCSGADKIICSGKFSLWLAILIRFVVRKKDLIAIVHGTELDLRSSIPKKLTTYALAKFNKIIAVSAYTQKHLPKNLPPKTGLFVIHNGVTGEEFKNVARKSLRGKPALITVGNVTARKGQENVVKALPAIISVYPDTFYHIIGRPTNKDRVIAVADKLGVEQYTRFHGAVGRTELLQTITGASIKLMLSNHTQSGDFEGFGIAVLEANALGIPAIGSRNSGIEDAIEHHQTGILVDPSDADEIVEAIKTITENYNYYSSNAKRWAAQHDWKIIVREYIAALNA